MTYHLKPLLFAALLSGSLIGCGGNCPKPEGPAPGAGGSPAAPVATAADTSTQKPPGPDATTASGGGPGGCTLSNCELNMDGCSEAKCMTPHSGGISICEYRAKFTGNCRCVAGDKRPCTSGGSSGWKTCLPAPSISNTDTYWGSCVL